MPRSPDVIVIGAGVAGLAAATALAEAGASVAVCEARGVLGGRASSVRDPRTGAIIDNGQHVLLGCYDETFRYLERVEARRLVALQRTLEVPLVDRQGRPTTLRCPDWPSPWHLLIGVMGWDALTWRDRFGVLALGPQLMKARRLVRTKSATAANDQTVARWLTQHHQTPRLVELLWEPLALAALNQPIEDVVAGPFIRVLGRVFGARTTDAAIGLPERPLSEVFGDPARAYLEKRGSLVRLHAPARLVMDGERAAGVDVRGERLRAGHVVAAVAWHQWRTLVSEHEAERSGLSAWRNAALARRSSPIVTVNVWLERAVLSGRFVGLPGRTFQWVFQNEPVSGAPTSGVHLSCVCSGAETVALEDDESLVKRAWEDVRHACPAASGVEVRHATVVRERHATFSLAQGEPPRPGHVTPVRGLWAAGDWTDTGLPATIESAVQSGHRAAAAIIDRRSS